ncbi:MAG: di-trans,poly-cis-decaprenylcistransferase, partial [Chloroflexi bacterium]|nr:di-trans,poly-cis-decaprenylcistransferase [Chloroflexota bacterium]
RAGTDNLHRILRAAKDFGVKVVTIYAFSTENWNRPRPEVMALMRILEQVIDEELEELHSNGVRIRHIGRSEGLSKRLVEKIRYAQDYTSANQDLVLNVAFNYGGRADVVDAVRQMIRDGVPADQVDEETISRYLSTGGLPDPDMIIRTGGDMRLSNFLIWQAAYSEFYSTRVFWPDFGRKELYQALLAYQQRERRFGGLPQTPA